MTRVLVCGARGRMGEVAVAAVESAADLTLAGTCVRGEDLGEVIRACQAQVVVDFTVPEVVAAHAETILEVGAHPVIGTSGLSPDDRDRLATRCAELGRGGVVAPNFAVGAVLLMRLARQAAAVLPDVEIIEAHHPDKVDAPSGTALATAEQLRRSAPEDGPSRAARGSRQHGVPVHSLRLTGLVAEQEVRFGGPGQTLSLCHRTYDRQAFAPGIVLACREVPRLDRLLLGLEELLFRDSP